VPFSLVRREHGFQQAWEAVVQVVSRVVRAGGSAFWRVRTTPLSRSTRKWWERVAFERPRLKVPQVHSSPSASFRTIWSLAGSLSA
jgi:hypothetical protein